MTGGMECEEACPQHIVIRENLEKVCRVFMCGLGIHMGKIIRDKNLDIIKSHKTGLDTSVPGNRQSYLR